jgi:hypothetical protein
MTYWTSVLIPAFGALLMFLILDPKDFWGPKPLRQAAPGIMLLSAVVCALEVMRWWRRAIFAEWRVRNFAEYESRVQSVLEAQFERDAKEPPMGD